MNMKVQRKRHVCYASTVTATINRRYWNSKHWLQTQVIWRSRHLDRWRQKWLKTTSSSSRVGVKYSWPSTQVHQVPQIYTKYKYWSSTHFLKKYLSTSSTFISSTSTSTSTHIKICSKVRMDIQSRVNFGWTKQKGFPQIMSAQVKMAIFYAE